MTPVNSFEFLTMPCTCILPGDVFINLINPNLHECLTGVASSYSLRMAQESALIAGLNADRSNLFHLFYRLSAVSGSLYRVVRHGWQPWDLPY